MDKEASVKYLLSASKTAVMMGEEEELKADALEAAGISATWSREQATMYYRRSDAYLNHAMKIACSGGLNDLHCAMDAPDKQGDANEGV